ncbi:MAG: hypothetical protein AAF479_18415 [Pseudomonadota bacterium]
MAILKQLWLRCRALDFPHRGKTEILSVPSGQTWPYGDVIEPNGATGLAFIVHPDREGQDAANPGEYVTGISYHRDVRVETDGSAFTAGQWAWWNSATRQVVPSDPGSGNGRKCFRIRTHTPGAAMADVPANNEYSELGGTAGDIVHYVAIAEFQGDPSLVPA